MNAITVYNLSKTYKVQEVSSFFRRKTKEINAINNISFDIESGELVGFVGMNGAGKTTTLKCLSGLLTRDGGDISVLGHDPQKRGNEFLKKISLVMGNKSQLWLELPPMDSFLLNKEIYEIPDSRFKKTLNNLVDCLDIQDCLNIPTRKLSLGNRMKCELVLSLLHNPEILFLDEPTIGLDVISQEKLRSFLKDYNKEHRSTILFTSHNMAEVNDLCSRVILINNGTIIYNGSVEHLKSLYGKDKKIRFTLKEKYLKKDVESIVKEFGKLQSFTGKSGVIVLTKDNTNKLLSVILRKLPIENIDIEQPSLEDVVRNIFSNDESISIL